MKGLLEYLLSIAFLIIVSQDVKSQNIILDFTNRKVSQDGLSWTFDLEAKGDAVTNYGSDITTGNWQGFNIRLDLELPAGVTILGGSGSGVATYTTGLANVQTSVPGEPPFGQREMGLTLARTNQTDLNNSTFVKIASYTVNFSGPVDQGNPAVPRPNAIASGSSWTNLVPQIRRPFILAPSFPLPVKLISFSATKEGSVAQLNWATSEEVNSDRFDVERSSDGKKWQQIGSVKSMGESKQTAYYSTTDSYPLNGSNLYRLHMIDKDGSSAYSKIESVNFEGQAKFIMFPNPLIDQISIKTNDWDKVAMIQIYNMQGKEVYNSANNLTSNINVKGLAGGMYLVKVTQKNNSSSDHKIIIAK